MSDLEDYVHSRSEGNDSSDSEAGPAVSRGNSRSSHRQLRFAGSGSDSEEDLYLDGEDTDDQVCTAEGAGDKRKGSSSLRVNVRISGESSRRPKKKSKSGLGRAGRLGSEVRDGNSNDNPGIDHNDSAEDDANDSDSDDVLDIGDLSGVASSAVDTDASSSDESDVLATPKPGSRRYFDPKDISIKVGSLCVLRSPGTAERGREGGRVCV